VGVIVYMMLTGVRPFEGTVLGDVIIKIYTETPVPPSTHVPELPEAVDSFIERALCRDPEGRFQSARELATEFAAIVGSHDGATLKIPSIPSGSSMPVLDHTVVAQDETRSLTAAILPGTPQPPHWLTQKRWWWYTAFAVEVLIIIAAFLLGGGGDDDTSPVAGDADQAAMPPAHAAGHAPAPSASASATASERLRGPTASDAKRE
jgi:serine/threonine protein kinase